MLAGAHDQDHVPEIERVAHAAHDGNQTLSKKPVRHTSAKCGDHDHHDHERLEPLQPPLPTFGINKSGKANNRGDVPEEKRCAPKASCRVEIRKQYSG